MKVVLLTTARSQRPSTLATLKAQLGVRPGDGTELTVVGWYRPKRPLPVHRNLLVGPDFNVRRFARVLPVGDPNSEPEPELEDEGLATAGTSPLEPDDRDSVDADGDQDDELVTRPVVPLGPIYDPRRVVKAVSWRARRTRRAVRRHPTVVRVRNSTKLRKLRNKVAPGGLGSRYAVACLRARNVQDEVASADVVVALDANTYRAAWLLARRHPAPAFVVGTAAGKRVLSELAAQA